jgi:hypothetical protein
MVGWIYDLNMMEGGTSGGLRVAGATRRWSYVGVVAFGAERAIFGGLGAFALVAA